MMDEAHDKQEFPNVWEYVKAILEQQMNSPSFNAWFRPTQYLRQDNNTLFIAVPDEITIYQLTTHYQEMIDDTLATAGVQATIRFEAAEGGE